MGAQRQGPALALCTCPDKPHNPEDGYLISMVQMRKARHGGGCYIPLIDKKSMLGMMGVLPPATPLLGIRR